MKRILCSVLVTTLPFGSVLAAEPKSNFVEKMKSEKKGAASRSDF
jgi:hypothetical protein